MVSALVQMNVCMGVEARGHAVMVRKPLADIMAVLSALQVWWRRA